MSRGFGELDLIELGFNRVDVDNGDYYYAIDKGKVRFITHQTKNELKHREFFTLIALADYEKTAITNPRDFKDVARVFG
jgi:hypothetical protein